MDRIDIFRAKLYATMQILKISREQICNDFNIEKIILDDILNSRCKYKDININENSIKKLNELFLDAYILAGNFLNVLGYEVWNMNKKPNNLRKSIKFNIAINILNLDKKLNENNELSEILGFIVAGKYDETKNIINEKLTLKLSKILTLAKKKLNRYYCILGLVDKEENIYETLQ